MIVGSGPAGLMAASVLAVEGCSVTLIEKRENIARKLFIAGSSGLNVASSLPADQLVHQYSGPQDHWSSALRHFTVEHWLDFISFLGLKWFKGTSARYFVKPMNAAPLVKAWRQFLKDRGVAILTDHDCVGFGKLPDKLQTVFLKFRNGESIPCTAACFALGGASYEGTDELPAWPNLFSEHRISLTPFQATNVGFEISWSAELLKEAEGKPLKNIKFKTAKGERLGELMITSYGIEGTPVYEVGIEGKAHIDLKPDLSFDQIISKLNLANENLSPLRRMKKYLALCGASQSLIFHHTPEESKGSIEELAKAIKNFPVNLLQRRPLSEAISSSGGIPFAAVDDELMLKDIPGVFVAGEMLDWSAPTGGFLIQGCVSQGFLAASGILRYLGLAPTNSAFWLPKIL